MTLLRRVLVTFAVMFWLGGFTFYAAVVVPIGTEVLPGKAIEQGGITRRVATWVNVSGAVALLLWGWEVAAEPPSSRRRQALRWLLWAVQVVALLLLLWWHPQMEALLDGESYTEVQRAFRRLHRAYLWTNTVQWGAAVLLLLSTLRTWHVNDRRSATPQSRNGSCAV
jgi:hypothetical protein